MFTQRTFAMVGPSRVGKTSLLAAMYNELENECAELGCQLIPDDDCQARINARRQELRDSTATKGIIVTAADGIEGSSAETDYAFTLKVPIAGQNAEEMKLRFVDMPGGWYVQAATADMKCANENISRSAASFWVVDAVAMMEDVPGKNRHHHANNPQEIFDAYKKAFSVNNGKYWEHTIVLVLARAETYIRQKKINEMQKRLKDEYQEHIATLRRVNPDLSLKVVATYIETVGTLFLQRFKTVIENGKEVEHVEFKCPDHKYQPRGCARPVLLALQAALEAEKNVAVQEEHKLNLLKQDVAEKKENLDQKLEEMRAVVNDAREEVENNNTWWQRWFGSELDKARAELSDASRKYRQAEREVEKARRKLEEAEAALAQAGNLSRVLTKKLSQLTGRLKKDEYIHM